MSSVPQYIITVHFNGETYNSDAAGFLFRNTQQIQFPINSNANFSYFKQRLETKVRQGPPSQIFYQHPVFTGENQVTFYKVAVEDDEDLQNMFCNHEYSGYDSIELYVVFQETVMEDPMQEEQAEVDVVDEEEELGEMQFNNMVNEESDAEEERQLPPHEMYTPPAYMTTLDGGYNDPSTDIFYTPHVQDDANLKVKDKFRSKEECVLAVKKFHMINNYDFHVDRTAAERYRVICRNAECKFHLTASYRLRSDSWVIGSMTEHTCLNSTQSQDHRKLSYDLICQEILPLVSCDPSLKVKTIMSQITTSYNYTPSYRKAWLAKNKAIEEIYGNWEGSYKELPRYMNALQYYAPGTIYEIETLPAFAQDGTEVSGHGIFRRIFWAFGPCITGFAHCKPIIQIDGTWLYGKYKGTLLMAVAQDGNNNVFPIAYAIVEGETGAAWSFFLKNLRTHVAPQCDLCLISDRHASIDSAYNNPANGWHDPPSTHVYCARHIVQNFMREIKDKKLRKTVMNAAYALTQPQFIYYRSLIRVANPDAGAWVDNLQVERWTRSYDNGVRWGHMTTNLVECMNGVFKGIRALPITALVSSTYFRMATLFAERGEMWNAVFQSGQQWSESCMKFIKREDAKASTHLVTRFDRHNHNFTVKETIDHKEGLARQSYRVKLPSRWCDCGKFQAF